MLKKIMLSLVLAVGLFGCSQAVENDSVEQVEQVEQIESTVSIEIEGIDGIEVAKDVVVEEGDILLEVLHEHFEVEEQDGFINGVDIIVADADNKEFLALYVNGEMSMVGAGEVELSDGDEVEFIVETWE